MWSKMARCPSVQCGGRRQALCHLQDGHRLWICRALQPVLVPQRPGAPLQKRLLGPTQRPPECKPGLPGHGPLSEPEPAPQMNRPPAVSGRQPGRGSTLFSHCIRGGKKKILSTKLFLFLAKRNGLNRLLKIHAFFARGWSRFPAPAAVQQRALLANSTAFK